MRANALRLVLATLSVAATANASTPDASAVFSPVVQALVSKMTLDEKLTMVQGSRDPAYNGGAGYIAGVPRLGVPPLRMADGPANVYVRYETTALPQPITLAATFSRDYAKQYGAILGRESRATRNDVLLGPMVNLSRLPNWGRNVTSFGEDPFVIGQMAAAEIGGIQSTGTLANAKHFLANNQSLNQGGGIFGADGFDFIVDPRTLHEIYLPGFEASLQAGVASVMASYNKTNGFWNAENEGNLIGLLRDELRWDGFVVSDWHANRSTPSIVAGLDMEMPGVGPQYPTGREGAKWGPRLKAAIEGKQVSGDALDRAVGRVLTQMEKFGFLDGTRVPGPTEIDVEGHAAFARKLAGEGAVLLKNQGNILPLSGEAAGDVLLIGPTADQLAIGPGISGFESRFISPREALQRSLGSSAPMKHVVGDELTGVAIPAAALTPEGGQGAGLMRRASDSTPMGVDAGVNFIGNQALPIGQGYSWRGTLKVTESGTYALQVHTWGGTGVLKIDGQPRAYSAAVRFGHGIPRKYSSVVPTKDGLDNAQYSVDLVAGKAYAIEVEGQAEPESKLQVRLAWVTPAMRRQNIAEAVAAAKEARTAVIFAWARSGEFDDPDQALRLPNDQDELISAVARVNSRTIVVFNSGSPHDMPWRDRVKGIVYLWYPGQEGGWATADVLLGKTNPGGRLAMTFPKKFSDVAAFDPKHPERYTGVNKQVVYSEGIFTGYRHFDEHKIAPLHPFGFGLSYTTFAYSNLNVTPRGDGFDVSFTVRNTGKLAGADVPQVYLERPVKAPVPMAPKTLVGFERVTLAPAEQKTVTVHVTLRQQSYWSEADRGWRKAEGARGIVVGSSSRDIQLSSRLPQSSRTP
ncbi:beta-glucosidase [Steroidobacter cummioxidans]|uniref:beta-glucosidase n=1 Tax=Steroidobacter cummioxidans TaxID=1803913 RepID=UPI000E30C344|nr:glycoside hydrolase family 3 C-terminal domain-containing protein [Steroidobacter cummioxidans]